MPLSNTDLALRGFALGSTLWISSAMASTSIIFIPALLRPLLASTTSSTTSSAFKSTPHLHPLQPQPQTQPEVHLTPRTELSNPLATTTPNPSRLAAQQFIRLDALSFRAQVPLELLTIAAFTTLSISTRRLRASGLLHAPWLHYASAATLIAAVFPYTGALMVPLVHKVARAGGDEDPVEPYEDAPLDPDAVKGNVVEFLSGWSKLNAWRTVGVLAAGVLGVRAWVLER